MPDTTGDADTSAPTERLFRIDVVDEESGAVVQSVKGIPGRKLQLALMAVGKFGSFVRDFQAARDAIRKARSG